MLKETLKLKSELESISSYRSRNDFIKTHSPYKNKSCYIISCGPSLNLFDFTKLKERLKDEMVVCIKQSFDEFKDICDLHIYNCANYKNYDYKNSNSIIVESTSFGKSLNPKAHLKYHILERRFDKSVSKSKQFSKWKLNNVYERPYGPGIMNEIVFYLLIHLGVKQITTIGWDNSLKGLNHGSAHFYDKDPSDRRKFVEFNDQKDSVPWENLLEEEKITIKAIDLWGEFLTTEGINMKIISDRNPSKTIVKCLPKIKNL